MDNDHYPTPPPPPKYATFIPGRSPNWKYYSNIGHAKNAMYQGSCSYKSFYAAELWLYNASMDQWVLVVNTRGMQFDSSKYQYANDQLKDLLSQFTSKTV